MSVPRSGNLTSAHASAIRDSNMDDEIRYIYIYMHIYTYIHEMKTNPTKPSKPTKPIPVHFFIFPHSYIIFVFVYRFFFFLTRPARRSSQMKIEHTIDGLFPGCDTDKACILPCQRADICHQSQGVSASVRQRANWPVKQLTLAGDENSEGKQCFSNYT